RVFRSCQRSWLHASHKTVVLGRCMADHLVAQYAMPEQQIAVIPLGYDPDQVFPMPKSTRFRAAHELRDFVVLYAGNLGRHQDFDTLLDAAALLRAAGSKSTFVFVGDGARK